VLLNAVLSQNGSDLQQGITKGFELGGQHSNGMGLLGGDKSIVLSTDGGSSLPFGESEALGECKVFFLCELKS
jgi:hypothetical protein